ncbi:MAG: hypothetical protein AB7O43_00610 [Hyphomicrobiaceae bacterium]
MPTIREDASGVLRAEPGYVEWNAIIAGAVASLAVSLVLLTFGAAVGLSAVSPWSSSSTTVTAVGIGSGFWILLVSLWSFALGGYIAGRLRHRWTASSTEESDFRDNAHGLLAWAAAVTFAGVIAALAPSKITTDQSWSGSPAASSAVDTMLRSTRAETLAIDPGLRGAVGRTLTRNLGSEQLAAGDRAYLAGVVAARSGVDEQAAATRVTEAFNSFKAEADVARKAGVIMAFLTASILLVGGAMAWWSAGVGGRHRDEGTVWETFRRHDRTRLGASSTT